MTAAKLKMSLLDKSEAFRGFLILIGQDGAISKEERTVLQMLGKKLDFEKSFVTLSINDLLENNHISLAAPHFSKKEFAGAFLRDAVMIACADHAIHEDEWDWLKSIAAKNNIGLDWLERVREESGEWSEEESELAVEHYL